MSGCRTESSPQGVVVEKSGNAATASPTAWSPPGSSITSPVTSCVDRLGRSPAVARHLRHAACSGLDEDDPETLLFEAAPPVPTHHREHVGAPVHQRQVVVVDSTQEHDRGIEFGGETPETLGVATATGDREDEIGMGGAHRRHRTDCGVESLARDESRDPDDQLGVDRQPEIAAGGGAFGVVEGAEALHVDAGRHHGGRQVATHGPFASSTEYCPAAIT